MRSILESGRFGVLRVGGGERVAAGKPLIDPYAGPPPEWDVVVVGGGLAGLTAARGLDRAGRRVSESATAVDLQRDQIRPAATRKLHVALDDDLALFRAQPGRTEHLHCLLADASSASAE
jgi:hypothetical protein